MSQVPEGKGVRQALRSATTAVKNSLAALNQRAADVMAKGDYARAEALANKGREIQAFQAELAVLAARWKSISSGGTAEEGEKSASSPLWSYYQPILKALVELGGEATRSEIEARVERELNDRLAAGDRQSMARGRERWQVMVRRARRHLITEGWLEPNTGKQWKITAAGRRAANAEDG
jgi:hypothetical protein